jgi:hypothetical protein
LDAMSVMASWMRDECPPLYLSVFRYDFARQVDAVMGFRAGEREMMGRLRGTVEYIYWSSRRTARFVEDNNLAAAGRQVTRTISSPALPWVPTLSSAATSSGSLRGQTARVIERALGPIAVARFDKPGPVMYAKGVSPVVFGEFWVPQIKAERQPAVMFTAANYGRGDPNSVAVCLYGSMDNSPEYVQDAGPGFRDGWVSSSAPAVYEFVKAHDGQAGKSYLDDEELAVEALRIADGQGITAMFTTAGDDDSLGLDRPRQRAYTYGDFPKAHWLAQIYLDVDLSASGQRREDGFRRILVGAPLWIRTSGPGAVQLYSQSQNRQIVEARHAVTGRGMVRAELPPAPSTERAEELQIVTTAAVEKQPQKHARSDGLSVPYDIYGPLRSGFIESQPIS